MAWALCNTTRVDAAQNCTYRTRTFAFTPPLPSPRAFTCGRRCLAHCARMRGTFTCLTRAGCAPREDAKKQNNLLRFLKKAPPEAASQRATKLFTHHLSAAAYRHAQHAGASFSVPPFASNKPAARGAPLPGATSSPLHAGTRISLVEGGVCLACRAAMRAAFLLLALPTPQRCLKLTCYGRKRKLLYYLSAGIYYRSQHMRHCARANLRTAAAARGISIAPFRAFAHRAAPPRAVAAYRGTRAHSTRRYRRPLRFSARHSPLIKDYRCSLPVAPAPTVSHRGRCMDARANRYTRAPHPRTLPLHASPLARCALAASFLPPYLPRSARGAHAPLPLASAHRWYTIRRSTAPPSRAAAHLRRFVHAAWRRVDRNARAAYRAAICAHALARNLLLRCHTTYMLRAAAHKREHTAFTAEKLPLHATPCLGVLPAPFTLPAMPPPALPLHTPLALCPHTPPPPSACTKLPRHLAAPPFSQLLCHITLRAFQPASSACQQAVVTDVWWRLSALMKDIRRLHRNSSPSLHTLARKRRSRSRGRA